MTDNKMICMEKPCLLAYDILVQDGGRAGLRAGPGDRRRQVPALLPPPGHDGRYSE